jgi:hypothetical protein
MRVEILESCSIAAFPGSKMEGWTGENKGWRHGKKIAKVRKFIENKEKLAKSY